jgi:alkylhydroperoxidase family enzyme
MNSSVHNYGPFCATLLNSHQERKIIDFQRNLSTYMARVKAIHKPSDYPDTADEQTKRNLSELFDYLFPQVADPKIDESHAGIAIAAQNPRLALQLAKLSGFIAGELPWCQRRDLRELAIQTVNVYFKCEYSFQARARLAEAAGIGADLQRALSFWKTSNLFDDTQRLVIEYANAVVGGDVPGELFSRVVGEFGEKGAVEFTTVVAFWSFWAMFLNATGAGAAPQGTSLATADKK